MSYQYWERYLGLPPVPAALQALGVAPPTKQGDMRHPFICFNTNASLESMTMDFC